MIQLLSGQQMDAQEAAIATTTSLIREDLQSVQKCFACHQGGLPTWAECLTRAVKLDFGTQRLLCHAHKYQHLSLSLHYQRQPFFPHLMLLLSA